MAKPDAPATRAGSGDGRGDIDAAFDRILGLCPASLREMMLSPPLRATQEITAYRTRIIAYVSLFGDAVPARAWGPLRDLAIGEVEADRYAAAIGGIVLQSRLAALADLLEEEARTSLNRAGAADGRTAPRTACERLARSWIEGHPRSVAEVDARLTRLGLTSPAIDDVAQLRSLPHTVPLERMRANATRTTARNRKLLELILAQDQRERRGGGCGSGGEVVSGGGEGCEGSGGSGGRVPQGQACPALDPSSATVRPDSPGDDDATASAPPAALAHPHGLSP